MISYLSDKESVNCKADNDCIVSGFKAVNEVFLQVLLLPSAYFQNAD